jgi:hypothetical protein
MAVPRCRRSAASSVCGGYRRATPPVEHRPHLIDAQEPDTRLVNMNHLDAR